MRKNTINQFSRRVWGNSRSRMISLTVMALLCGASAAEAGLKIYYIRHAEGGHNVKKHWKASDIPESEWPEYVGDPNVFTPKGLEQVAAATEALQKYDFDFIASSPVWRARNTILPYLKITKQKAEVWPELLEIRASSLILLPDLAAPTYKIFDQGDPIKLTAEEASCFSLRSDGENNLKLPRFRDKSQSKEEAAVHRLIIQTALDRVKKGYGGTDKSVLLVGHKGSGTGILRMLLNDRLQKLSSIANTGVWMVEEMPNGEFELRMFNGVPLQ